jgi:hypothetical protein
MWFYLFENVDGGRRVGQTHIRNARGTAKYIPTTRSSAKVDKSIGIVEETVFLVQLYQLKRSTRAITMILSKVVESEYSSNPSHQKKKKKKNNEKK